MCQSPIEGAHWTRHVGYECDEYDETTRPTGRARTDFSTMAYAGYAPGHRVIERTPLEEALLEIGDAETLDGWSDWRETSRGVRARKSIDA